MCDTFRFVPRANLNDDAEREAAANAALAVRWFGLLAVRCANATAVIADSSCSLRRPPMLLLGKLPRTRLYASVRP